MLTSGLFENWSGSAAKCSHKLQTGAGPVPESRFRDATKKPRPRSERRHKIAVEDIAGSTWGIDPRAPTDPDVQIQCIRFLISRLHCAAQADRGPHVPRGDGNALQPFEVSPRHRAGHAGRTIASRSRGRLPGNFWRLAKLPVIP